MSENHHQESSGLGGNAAQFGRVGPRARRWVCMHSNPADHKLDVIHDSTLLQIKLTDLPSAI